MITPHNYKLLTSDEALGVKWHLIDATGIDATGEGLLQMALEVRALVGHEILEQFIGNNNHVIIINAGRITRRRAHGRSAMPPPQQAISTVIERILPRAPLRKSFMDRIHIFRGSDHIYHNKNIVIYKIGSKNIGSDVTSAAKRSDMSNKDNGILNKIESLIQAGNKEISEKIDSTFSEIDRRYRDLSVEFGEKHNEFNSKFDVILGEMRNLTKEFNDIQVKMLNLLKDQNVKQDGAAKNSSLGIDLQKEILNQLIEVNQNLKR